MDFSTLRSSVLPWTRWATIWTAPWSPKSATPWAFMGACPLTSLRTSWLRKRSVQGRVKRLSCVHCFMTTAMIASGSGSTRWSEPMSAAVYANL